MAKLKKTIPTFESEKEEAEYWDKHSILEHFDESDFSPLQVRAAKDNPITIRLDSESRQKLEEMAKAYRVGPSTLARVIISSMYIYLSEELSRIYFVFTWRLSRAGRAVL